MPSVADNDAALPSGESWDSTDQIISEPEQYIQHARVVQAREAHAYVEQEIARRVVLHAPTRVDTIVRLGTYVLAFSASLSLIATAIALLTIR